MCQTFKHVECDIKPKKKKVKGFKGTNVNVKVSVMMSKSFSMHKLIDHFQLFIPVNHHVQLAFWIP